MPGGGNPQAYNRYSYVFNNPLRYQDPSGNQPYDPMIDGQYGSSEIRNEQRKRDIRRVANKYGIPLQPGYYYDVADLGEGEGGQVEPLSEGVLKGTGEFLPGTAVISNQAMSMYYNMSQEAGDAFLGGILIHEYTHQTQAESDQWPSILEDTLGSNGDIAVPFLELHAYQIESEFLSSTGVDVGARAAQVDALIADQEFRLNMAVGRDLNWVVHLSDVWEYGSVYSSVFDIYK